ncbi:putative lipid II flippase FtsW [Blastococcus goldschmidtiae]|uniref:Probable peptidoglycan glycosyltransferase FtsW n=1 Tax=Blastococcus goldschmidtiae TaxID=3075546 RepID=A0ABU2K9K8_9ACTN|nr:putative lipid II flippase FtsW [Blastococcus sp. DSM 46792]MDT0276879.1 putative lipid II flippase FtsW [Blastococcus sp. DSM 46792]
MTTTQARPRPVRAPREDRAPGPSRRWSGPAWLDGPMTSCHLVLGAAGLLLLIGLTMVFSASAIDAALNDQPAWAPGVKQLMLACIGLVGMVVAMRLPVGLVRRWSPVALLVVGAMLLLVLVPGIGVKLNGARQWIDLGFMYFQPSELGKLVFALWGAHVLALRERYLTTTSLLVPVLPVFGILALLIIAEPDFGGVVSLGLVLVGLLWAGGMPLRWFGWMALAGAALLAAVALLSPVRMARLTSFMDPFADPSNTGFQAIRGFYALASGGLSGVGLGNSAMKWNILPEAESDYIFAIIGEELGFLGCLVVVTLYGVLAYAGFRIARRAADRFVQLACVAITVWLVGQATMNMGYVVGLLPVTGVTLPLISAGGTSLILTLVVVGLLARFACTEPAAVESLRGRDRGRLARLVLPAPSAAVEPVRPRRRPEERDARRPAVGGGRTVVHARSAPTRRGPAPSPGRRERPAAAPRPIREGRPVRDQRPIREGRPVRDQRPIREERPVRGARAAEPPQQRPALRNPAARRPGGAR